MVSSRNLPTSNMCTGGTSYTRSPPSLSCVR